MALFIFDCNSHYSRCFKIATKEGEPDASVVENHKGTTPMFYNGKPVYVLPRVLRLVRNEIRAIQRLGITMTHIALIFDHPGKNFRHDIFPLYKAGRPEKSDHERIQLGYAKTMFEQQGFPCIQVPGVESDDVIGTITGKLKLVGMPVVVFTGDKDMLSEVDENTFVYRGVEKKLYDRQAVLDKFGLPPEKIHDYLSMTGDMVDGFGGVPNVGPKKAVQILSEISFDEMCANPDFLETLNISGGGKIIDYIKSNPDELYKLKVLAKLKRDVELGVNLNQLKLSNPTVSNIYHGIV